MKQKIKVGTNGFGRIGRAITKINAQYDYFDIVLINDINPHVDNLAYLFKYDSTYGKFSGNVDNTVNEILINGNCYTCTAHENIQNVPWREYGVSIIIDASGVERNIDDAKKNYKRRNGK